MKTKINISVSRDSIRGKITKSTLGLGMIISLIMASAAATAQSHTPADLNNALNSYVSTDSQGWWANTYDRGSMNGASITQISDGGRSFVVRGYYTYNGGSRGYVDALIRDNKLVCLQFWDRSSCNPMRTRPAPWAEVIVGAVAVGVIASAAAGSRSSGSSYSGAGSRPSQDHYYYRTEPAPTTPTYRPDTSVGCAWGDRAYGTCQ